MSPAPDHHKPPRVNELTMSGLLAMYNDLNFDAENLGRLRLAKGLTLAALGAEIGLTGAAVSKWEQGRSRPEIIRVPKLVEVLGCEISDLFQLRPAA